MLFAVDIGNSNIHLGIFEGKLLCHSFRLGTDAGRTSDEYAMLMRGLLDLGGYASRSFEGAVLGSVVPSVTETVKAAVAALLHVPVTIVGPGIKTGFRISVNDPAELGADLVANAAGAIDTVGAPALVADFGTATTLIAIDGQGAFQGGGILPGVKMSLDALHGAELLPGVSVEHPVSALGKNTAECMRAGVLRGGAMAVTGLAEQYKQMLALPRNTAFLVCGGFAERMMAYLPAGARHIPELTLHGLAAIWRLNRKS